METLEIPESLETAAAEDVLSLPPQLTRGATPRRGSSDAKAPRPKKDADALFRTSLAAEEQRVQAAITEAGTEADLAAEARRPDFGDLSACTPLGAAVAAAFLLSPCSEEVCEAVVDAWVGARGVTFAVTALLELGGVSVTVRHSLLPTLRRTGVGYHPHERRAMAARAKAHLVAADDAEYAAAMAVAESARGGGELVSALTSFLFPERTDWVDADLATIPAGSLPNLLPCLLLGSAVTNVGQGLEAAARIRFSDADIPSLLAALGPGDATLVLRSWLQADPRNPEDVLSVLAHIPTDGAFDALVEHAGQKYARVLLMTAADRFPGRGIRRLAEATGRPADTQAPIDQLLRLRVLATPGLARAVLPALGVEARSRIEAHLASDDAVPAADPGTLPAFLTSPPWAERAAAGPAVVKGLTAPTETTLTWLAGEEEEWSREALPPFATRTDWSVLAHTIADGRADRLSWFDVARFALRAPEEMVRPLLPQLTPEPWKSADWVPAVVVRLGLDTWPLVLAMVKGDPERRGRMLLPFEGPEIALYWADALARLKSARAAAAAWFDRHPAAARFLVPAALGRSGPARRGAEAALVWLAANGHAAEVGAAAEAYGAPAVAAVKALVSRQLAVSLPAKMPVIPWWARPAALPRVLLADRRSVLPPEAVETVVMLVALSTPEAPFPGLDAVRELCDRRSLGAFSWALFEHWEALDSPSAQRWAMDSMRWFGDDECVRRLSPLIRDWPGQSAHQRAVTGLDVLTAIGGDTAMLHLLSISQKVKFRGLREEAARQIQVIAERLRLTPEELADRLVPDLGLDARGTMTLDYGPRSFVVGFDEQLKPRVADRAGKVLKALPKPGAKDDPDVAAASYERFAGLKKDVRTLASDQIRRCELAMVRRRRWTAEQFAQYFVGHPLVRHLARRLVWAVFGPDGTAHAAFRVAEDLTFADVEDDVFTLPGDTVVGIAHPLDLGEDLARWAELFADYKILQPFSQLGRPVMALTEQELARDVLDRFSGVKMPAVRIFALEKRGWRRSDPADAGSQTHVLRDLPDGRMAVVDLDPGLSVGWVADSADQEFERVWISDPIEGYNGYLVRSRTGGTPFSALDPITASEILRDLTEVTTP